MEKISSFWFVQGLLNKFSDLGICAKPALMHSVEKVARGESLLGGYEQTDGKNQQGRRTAQGMDMKTVEDAFQVQDFQQDVEQGNPAKNDPEEAGRVHDLLACMAENEDHLNNFGNVSIDDETEGL